MTHTAALPTLTYRQLHRQEMTWIAGHVAGDLLDMNDPDDVVSAHDWAKIVEARRRDAQRQGTR